MVVRKIKGAYYKSRSKKYSKIGNRLADALSQYESQGVESKDKKPDEK
jgi:hypothetical protein